MMVESTRFSTYPTHLPRLSPSHRLVNVDRILINHTRGKHPKNEEVNRGGAVSVWFRLWDDCVYLFTWCIAHKGRRAVKLSTSGAASGKECDNYMLPRFVPDPLPHLDGRVCGVHHHHRVGVHLGTSRGDLVSPPPRRSRLS